MKIAVIRQKYVNYGGAERFVSEYASQLADAGHELHIFAHQWTAPRNPRIHLHPVRAFTINAFLRSLSFAWFAAREARRDHYDIIQSHERTFYQDIYRAGDGCHKQWLLLRKKQLSPLKRRFLYFNLYHWLILWLEKGLFERNRCKKIIAISEMVKRDILRHYMVSEDNIEVVYNGVDLNRFNPENRNRFRKSVRERLGIGGEEVMILFVGSGFERKGLKFLLQATEYLNGNSWRLVVLGRGNDQKYVSFAPERIRDRLLFLDPVEEVESFYAAADMFVLPSLYEPFGNVNLQALASGLPLVTSRYSGAAEILNHRENGMVVENPADPREIAETINYLFDAGVRNSMGQKARTLAEQFTLERNVEEMLAIYNTLVSSVDGPEPSGVTGSGRNP